MTGIWRVHPFNESDSDTALTLCKLRIRQLKKPYKFLCKALIFSVGVDGFEPPTLWV